MKELKLTILIEPGKKSEVINMFGTNYHIIGKRLKFIQYSFPDIKMFTPFKVAPVYNLLRTLEQHCELRYKMFHLFDEEDGSYAPVYFESLNNKWQCIQSSTGKSNSVQAENLLTIM